MRLFALFVVMAGAAMAGLVVTADPATSAAWPVGQSFEPGEVSQTIDPLGPFSNIPIQFRGWQQGGSQVSIDGNPCSNNDPCLVFFYHLNFSTPTAINSISFTGDAFNLATFELLNSGNAVIDSRSVSSGNVGHNVTYTLPTPGASGTSFSLKLFDDSTTWTFVNNISVNTTPEPATCSTVLASLGVIAWIRRRRDSRRYGPASVFDLQPIGARHKALVETLKRG
jgi:hypothetical protein